MAASSDMQRIEPVRGQRRLNASKKYYSPNNAPTNPTRLSQRDQSLFAVTRSNDLPVEDRDRRSDHVREQCTSGSAGEPDEVVLESIF